MKNEEWKNVKLEDLCDELSDGLHKAPVFVENGEYIFVNAKNLAKGYIVDPDKSKHTSYEEYLKYKIDLNERTILYSIDGTIGNIARYRGEKCVLGKGACYINLKKDIFADFIYYQLQSPHFNRYINHLTTGSTIGHISLKTMRNYTFSLPPLAEQQRIAKILSALDDKIELNNAINRNLEEQAQALFKNWFVDFAPFGGEMPDDWTTASLSDIADYLNGLAMQKFRPKENEVGLPVLKIKELRQGFPGDDAEQCSPSIKPEYIVNDGDVIFSWSGSLLVDLWCGGTCGLNQHLFKVTSPKYDKWFYYLWTKHHLDRFVFLAADKATTMGHIKRDELDKAEVCIPSKADYNKIGSSLEPMIETIIAKRVENQRLTTLRKELLPKLMSEKEDS